MKPKRPNILLIQADQLRAQSLPTYNHPVVKAPNIASLAEDGVVFENAYCNNPICAPSRFSMLAGQHTSKIGAYDNGAEFPADIPTIAHYLRAGGYQTCLAGKMHFVGADQLHGYEERLTTDVYPSDHGWTPDWKKPKERFDWWYHNMDSVRQAAPCERTNQIDFDDEVEFHAVRKIYNIARSDDPRPFFLTVSFTDPHDPYACPKEHWDRYSYEEIDMPRTGYIADKDLDPHSRRLREAYLQAPDAVTDEEVRNARRAYYGQISYIDDKIGSIKKALKNTGFADNTIIIFTADHGDMLGEKGLWYKMSFFEESVRVPLIISSPGNSQPTRVDNPVSLVDLLPTILELTATPGLEEPAADLDGKSLVPLLEGTSHWPDRPVISEFFAEGSIAPCFMVRRGQYKYMYCEADPPQLYNLENDPTELDNIVAKPEYAEIAQQLKEIVMEHHNPEKVRRDVLASQKRRMLVFAASKQGKRNPWDFIPIANASEQYMRNHLDLNDVEDRARITSRK